MYSKLPSESFKRGYRDLRMAMPTAGCAPLLRPRHICARYGKHRLATSTTLLQSFNKVLTERWVDAFYLANVHFRVPEKRPL
jgi:hypothetical protein